MSPHRTALALLAVGVLLASCSAGDDGATGAGTRAPSEDLAITVASFDLSVGKDQRFLAGVLTPDRQVIGGGTVEMAFSRLVGDGGAAADGVAADGVEPSATATGSFLPVPGTPTPADLTEPAVLGRPAGGHGAEGGSGHEGSSGGHEGEPEDLSASGVYQATADFDRAGFWQVTVTADLEGKQRTGSAVFEVQQDA